MKTRSGLFSKEIDFKSHGSFGQPTTNTLRTLGTCKGPWEVQTSNPFPLLPWRLCVRYFSCASNVLLSKVRHDVACRVGDVCGGQLFRHLS